MTVTRRGFVKTLGWGGMGLVTAPMVAARGREALVRWPADASATDAAESRQPISPRALRLDSNENPNGPGAASLDAIRSALREASRYPHEANDALRDGLAGMHGVAPENILLGCGSGEILRMAAFAFTSPARALVTGAPSFEDPARHAGAAGAEVRAIPVDGSLMLDLDRMAAVAGGAGLVFLCNPNNPTATVHSQGAVRAFAERVLTASPETIILVDEAYHEYVEDAEYATAIPLAVNERRIVVARTFSKVFGLAGLRVGYGVGVGETLAHMQRFRLPNSVNVLGSMAALAVLEQPRHVARERSRNREAREYSRRALAELGYPAGPSETNFIMVDVRRDAREFQTACRELGVLVGRPFPPLNTHVRISIGTMQEMRRAIPIFRSLLANA